MIIGSSIIGEVLQNEDWKLNELNKKEKSVLKIKLIDALTEFFSQLLSSAELYK